MIWVVLAVALVLIGAVVVSRRVEAQRKEARRLESVAKVSKVAEEDITRFGEELMLLDADTFTTSLDEGMRQDYQRALDSYETAGRQLRDVKVADDVTEVTRTLEDGRYALACVRARVAGEPLPKRRPPCFFNPSHGPALTDVLWSPPGGVQRDVPVCMADAERVAQGAEPDTRKVQVGNKMVPWYQGGPAYGPYAGGYYGAYAMHGLFPGFIIGSMMMGGTFADQSLAEGAEGGSGEGGVDYSGEDYSSDWSGGGDVGGGDMSGGGGYDLGGGGDIGGGGGYDIGGGGDIGFF